MNVRRALSWFRHRLVTLAEAGVLRVRYEGKMVDAVDADDVDAWLIGNIPPSYADFRSNAPAMYADLGGEVIIPGAVS